MRQAFVNTKEQLLEVQRLQMLEGLNADGDKIGKYKNPKYALRKNEMNPVPGLGVPDLNLTGQWQGELDVKIDADTIEIIAPDNDKTANLVSKFTARIIGLNEYSSKVYAQQYLKPEFIRLMKDALR